MPPLVKVERCVRAIMADRLTKSHKKTGKEQYYVTRTKNARSEGRKRLLALSEKLVVVGTANKIDDVSVHLLHCLTRHALFFQPLSQQVWTATLVSVLASRGLICSATFASMITGSQCPSCVILGTIGFIPAETSVAVYPFVCRKPTARSLYPVPSYTKRYSFPLQIIPEAR